MERRKIQIGTLDDAVRDAEQLLINGYRSVGNWNLAQTLGHCNDWLRFPMDGYPPANFLMRGFLTLARLTVGKSMYRKIVRERAFKTGSPTMPETVKKPDFQQDAESLQAFKKTVERFKAFSGQPHASPLFGALTLDQHRELQLVHLQHHLSFLIPGRG